jgi:hypothetical protein
MTGRRGGEEAGLERKERRGGVERKEGWRGQRGGEEEGVERTEGWRGGRGEEGWRRGRKVEI